MTDTNIYKNTSNYYIHIEEISKDFFSEYKEEIAESLKDGDSLTEVLCDEIHQYSSECAENEIIYYYNSFKICELFEYDSISTYFEDAELEVDFSQYDSLKDLRQAIAYYICDSLFNEEITQTLEKMEREHFEKEYHKVEGTLTK
jgi:hypothetical protein